MSATALAGTLSITVADDGIGVDLRDIESSSGTGLRRLRERMRWLYGGRARLDLASDPGGGFSATLVVPQVAANNASTHRERGGDDHA